MRLDRDLGSRIVISLAAVGYLVSASMFVHAVMVKTPAATSAAAPMSTARLAAAKNSAKVLGASTVKTNKQGTKMSKSAAASSTSKSTSKTTSSAKSPRRFNYIGIFVTISPSDPTANTQLDAIAATGVNLIYDYTPFDGSVAQVEAFLNHAGSKGLKVVMGMQDFYDQLPDSASTVQTYSQYGSTSDQIAQTVVQDFQANPAVWGFSISDENPATPSDVPTWQPILQARYAEIKGLTSKPVMSILVGWNDPSDAARRSLFRAVGTASDILAVDYYPIPFMSLANIPTLVADSASVKNTWFIEQDFSWSSYPDTITGLGYNASQSRYPTAAEMISMGQAALGAGATSLMFYSYFDISSNPAQVSQLTQAVSALK